MGINLKDYTYVLPETRIADHPATERGLSKLLVYKQGDISHHRFVNIIDQIDKEATLVFNDTKVIPARIVMHKQTGARIEIFLLEPISPSAAHEAVMISENTCSWKCMIGNAKKWKIGTTLSHQSLEMSATRMSADEVRFDWKGITFSELLGEIGKIPLPPYIEREVDEVDKERYQTVYSKMNGAVAAPTAGLHFTEDILAQLPSRGILTEYVTLHVSAGTFQPIKSDDITEHPMHNEQVWVKRDTIQTLLSNKQTIVVGTTSMRTLESLYWFGVKLQNGEKDFFIGKDTPYSLEPIDKIKALENILSFMDENNLSEIGGQTEIFIYPGYTFKMCDGLITNYHMPSSTLVLLVAAFIGKDWRRVYQAALDNDYRFLSYGDSSLLIP